MQANSVIHQGNSIRTLIRKLSILPLLIIPTLFSTACNSAPQNKLQLFDYRDAIRFFEKQHPNDSGAWLCSYTEHKIPEGTNPPEILIQEIDAAYLYIKKNNNIIELIRSSEKENPTEYTSIQSRLDVRIKIIKESNFSEYQESHDRIVEVEINTPGEKYSLQLLGESCGI